MTKYVYILRRLDYDGIIDSDKEWIIFGLENAKTFTRQKLFEDVTYVVNHAQFSPNYRQETIELARKMVDSLSIKLNRETWAWTYLEDGSYSGTWELKRLKVV